MGLFDKLKKKKTMFMYDEKYNEFVVELNGIKFVCEKVKDNYEQLVKDLASTYEAKLPAIVKFLLPDVSEMFGVSDVAIIQSSLGKPQIDLDKSMIIYCEQTLDDVHIVSVEFGGLFTEFYYSSIDG